MKHSDIDGSFTRWRQAVLSPESTIQDAIRNLEKLAIQIVLVVNKSGRFEGTVSDGDIRRGLLRGLDLGSPLKSVVSRSPLVVPAGVDRSVITQLMTANKIRQIPIINEDNTVIGLHLWDNITSQAPRTNLMVIMCGGFGKRLRPYTETCPKPMLHVAGRPILEHIIVRAKSEGFCHFVLAVNYLSHIIEDYFLDGARLNVSIDYLKEENPLGTVGALSLLSPHPDASFVVTNGDIITDIRYGELLDFHTRQRAIATMAVRLHEWQHPFGVVHLNGVEIIGFEEKPVNRSHINAGVYVLEPSALGLLESGVRCDMPTLFERLQLNDRKIVAYPMHEPWLDVGRPYDLEKANQSIIS